MTEMLSRRTKLLLTASIYVCFFAFGVASCIVAPARLDIADLLGVGFPQVSYGTVARASGYVAGALVATILFLRINRQIGLVVSLIGSGLFMFVVPFLRSLWIYLLIETLTGFMMAGVDTACNSWILEIWQESANPYMQGMHFCFALGMTLAPLVTEPFLSPEKINGTVGQTEGEANNNSTGSAETRIVIPYSIGSAAFVATGLLLLLLYFQVPYVDPKRTVSGAGKRSEKEKNNNDDSLNNSQSTASMDGLIIAGPNAKEEKVYYIQMIVLGCFLLCFYTGLELSSFNFIPEFAVVIALKLSKSKAAFLTSVMSAAFAANRFICIFVASKIRPKTMLYASFVMLVAGNIMLLIFANSSETMLWIAVILMGCGHSSIYPCIMSFLEQRMNVTTSVCAVFMLFSVVSSIVVPIVIGNLVEEHPLVYVFVNLFLLTACAAIFAALWFVDRRFRRRHRHPQVS